MREQGARRMAARVEEPAKDRLLDAELFLTGSAGAADLVADDAFTPLLPESSYFLLELVGLRRRQFQRTSEHAIGRPGVVVSQLAGSQTMKSLGVHYFNSLMAMSLTWTSLGSPACSCSAITPDRSPSSSSHP